MGVEADLKGSYKFHPQGEQLTAANVQQQFPGAENHGHLGETGVLLHKEGVPVAFALHPKLIPAELRDGEPVFGGLQTSFHGINIRPRAGEARRIASTVRGTTPTLGPEAEAFVHDAETAELVPTSSHGQIETQKALREDPQPHTASLEDHAVASARLTIARSAEEAGAGRVAIETSVPITFGEKNALTSEGLEVSSHPYIVAMTHLFPDLYMISEEGLDPQITSVLNQYALRHGFGSIQEMTRAVGLNRTWHMAASHISLGLPQERQGNGKYSASTEIAIGMMNTFISDLNISHMFTRSTPMLGGQLVDVPVRHPREGQSSKDSQPLADVRLGAFKYWLGSAYPGPLINSEEDLYARWEAGIIGGTAATVDRLSAVSIAPSGEIFPSMHARARLRVAGDGVKPSVRVESVGDSATPSLYDRLARDAYLVVLWNGAMEAMATGQTPQEFWGENYPAITDWRKQQEATLGFSVEGPANTEAAELIGQNIRFLHDMKNLQPQLGTYIDYVLARIDNFYRPTQARNLDEYTTNPTGSISEVIRQMKLDGKTDAEIVRAIDRHQTAVAKRVIQAQGNFAELTKDIRT